MERIKSSFDDHTEFNLWETPVINLHKLLLLGCASSSTEHFYFFFGESIGSKIIYQLEFHPFNCCRAIENRVALNKIAPLLESDIELDHGFKTAKTFRLWNTEFIREANRGWVLSNYSGDKENNVCEYLVKTENEWIIITNKVSFDAPSWVTYQDISLKDLMKKTL